MERLADRIKGITVVIGGDTTGLSKALKETNRSIGDTASQLKDVEKLLKLDPTNTKLLEQRQRLLADAVGKTKDKLDTLKKAEKQVQEQFKQGKVSQEQYDGLQREIIDTELYLKNLEKQASKSNAALSAISAGASKVSKTMAPVTAGLVGLASAAIATVPATEELRSDLSKLDANAQENAVSAEAARNAWREFAVQSGETDSAVEATSNLLQAGFTESNLQKAVEGLAGAAQRFPDTLKIESLADSLQETLATGSATGQFGELLDRLGVGAENFSAQLADCATDAEKQNLALQTLADAGLNDSYNAWKQNNDEMLSNQEANLKLQESMAALAETVLPFITAAIEKITDLLNWFNSLDSGMQKTIAVIALLVAAISPVAGIISTISGAISFIVSNPIVLLIAAIVALVALIATKGQEIIALLQSVDDFLQNIFVTDWTNIFGPVLGSILNGFFAAVSGIWNGIKQILEGIINFIQGVFTGNWQQAWEGLKSILQGVWDAMVGVVKAPINAIIGLINGLIGAINGAIGWLNRFQVDIPEWVPDIGGGTFGFNIPEIPTIPFLAKGGTVLSGSAIVGEAGPELLTVGPGGTRVQPLSAGPSTGARAAAVVNIESVTFNGYTPQQGREFVRDLNRQLGRLYV